MHKCQYNDLSFDIQAHVEIKANDFGCIFEHECIKSSNQLVEFCIEGRYQIDKGGFHIVCEYPPCCEYEICIVGYIMMLNVKTTTKIQHGKTINNIVFNIFGQIGFNNIHRWIKLLCDQNQVFDKGKH